MSSPLLSKTLAHLDALVGFDTQNPPREIEAEGGIFAYLAAQLSGFELELTDIGDGCLSLLARRGNPRLLFNFHIDTVPVAAGWTTGPHQLQVTDERAIGLGACDIKGASACMLAAVQATAGDVALLFTSDEEAGSSRCVRAFCEQHPDYDAVIVAEPTMARAVLEHRGIATSTATFTGTAGHASSPTALDDSALHEAAHWVSRAVEHARAEAEHDYRGLHGICFNVGVISGGTKPNVIASSATVRWGIRPRPDQDTDQVIAAIQSRAADPSRVSFAPGFRGPSLPARAAAGLAASGDVAPRARKLAQDLGLPVAQPVNFWTEASLFSEAGYTALVYGPGDIAQAHTVGEWVALEQLEEVVGTYVRLLGG